MFCNSTTNCTVAFTDKLNKKFWNCTMKSKLHRFKLNIFSYFILFRLLLYLCLLKALLLQLNRILFLCYCHIGRLDNAVCLIVSQCMRNIPLKSKHLYSDKHLEVFIWVATTLQRFQACALIIHSTSYTDSKESFHTSRTFFCTIRLFVNIMNTNLFLFSLINKA